MNKFLRIGEKLSEISVCGNDIAEYSIVFHSSASLRSPAMAPEYIEKGAAVLQNYIYKISGINIPIIYDRYPLKTDREILIGGTNREYDESANVTYRDDDYDIIVKNGLVIINGGKRGILYGVYSFIEKCLGVRFFTKDVEKLLYRDKIEITDFTDSQRPVFEYRDICDWAAFDTDFSVKSKVNGSFVRRLHAADGGSVQPRHQRQHGLLVRNRAVDAQIPFGDEPPQGARQFIRRNVAGAVGAVEAEGAKIGRMQDWRKRMANRVADDGESRHGVHPLRRVVTSITLTWFWSWAMIWRITRSSPNRSIFMRETVPSSVGPTESVWML